MPSIVIPPDTDAAVALGRDADAAGVVCARIALAVPIRSAAATVL